MIQAATERFHLTRDESEAIDAAWAELSAKWTQENGPELSSVGARSNRRDNKIPDNERVGGLKACTMVDREGLEPPTPAL